MKDAARILHLSVVGGQSSSRLTKHSTYLQHETSNLS